MSAHVVGNRFTYFLVFLALMVGTAVTVWVTYFHIEVGAIRSTCRSRWPSPPSRRCW